MRWAAWAFVVSGVICSRIRSSVLLLGPGDPLPKHTSPFKVLFPATWLWMAEPGCASRAPCRVSLLVGGLGLAGRPSYGMVSALPGSAVACFECPACPCPNLQLVASRWSEPLRDGGVRKGGSGREKPVAGGLESWLSRCESRPEEPKPRATEPGNGTHTGTKLVPSLTFS